MQFVRSKRHLHHTIWLRNNKLKAVFSCLKHAELSQIFKFWNWMWHHLTVYFLPERLHDPLNIKHAKYKTVINERKKLGWFIFLICCQREIKKKENKMNVWKLHCWRISSEHFGVADWWEAGKSVKGHQSIMKVRAGNWQLLVMRETHRDGCITRSTIHTVPIFKFKHLTLRGKPCLQVC